MIRFCLNYRYVLREFRLIAAILFLMYKKMNNLEGYKIAMMQFMHDLHKSIIKDIVLFCGGDPDLVDQRL